MDLKNIIQGENRKKFLIIGFIILLLIDTEVFFLTRTPSTPANNQTLSDLSSLAPKDNATSSAFLKQAPIITLSVEPDTIAPGQSSKITWSTSNATNCVNGIGDPLNLMGDISISPTAPYTFDISCTGPNGTDIQSVTVQVTTAPIINISATPAAVFSGQPSLIAWNTVNADRCVDATGKTLRLEGNTSVSPKTAYTFTMSCTGPKGTTKKSITVAIAKPTALTTTSGNISGTYTTPTDTSGTGAIDTTTPDVQLTALATSIDYNKTATIKWTLKNVSYCVFTSDGDSLSGLPPIISYSGTRTTSPLISPPSTVTYTLSCSKGTGKIAKSVTINVGAKPIADTADVKNFHASKTVAAAYEPVTFYWDVAGATSCNLKNTAGGGTSRSNLRPSGSTVIAEKGGVGFESVTYTYTMVCVNADGVETTSAPVTTSVVNCRFPIGFSKDPKTGQDIDPATYTNGAVEPYNGGAICTYTFGTPKTGGSWDIVHIFGFLSQIEYAFGGSRTVDDQHLCPYTRYYTKSTTSGIERGNWLDKTYHSGWKLLPTSSTEEVSYMSCGYKYSTTYWNGSGWTSEGDCGSESCRRLCNTTVHMLNSIKCLVQ